MDNRKPLDVDTVRVIKLEKDALIEFIRESLIDRLSEWLDIDATEMTTDIAIDLSRGEAMLCAYRTEDDGGNVLHLPVDASKLLSRVSATADSVYGADQACYRDYTKGELAKLTEK